jgi:hypothetical protein
MALGLVGVASAAPQLEWDQTKVEVEMGPADALVQVEYRVRNTGATELRFNRVESSCGCTAALPEKRVLAAGESTVVTAVFEKGKRQGRNGSVLRVYLEGATEPVAYLNLEVNIIEAMELQPEILYWKRGVVGPRVVRVQLHPEHAAKLDTLRFNGDALEVKADLDPQKPGQYVLVVEPIAYDASLREKIVIRALNAAGKGVGEKTLFVFVQP